jgi:hypothetical protein
VNEPAPSVLERRPDAPPRVAMAVTRAMAKNPDDRFQSMGELCSELEAALAEMDPASEEATMIARRPVTTPASRRKRRTGRRRGGFLWPIAAVLGVFAVSALAAFGVIALRDGDGSPQAAPNAPVRLTGVGSFDPPPGDSAEHDAEAPLATDGDTETYWTTETYQDFSNSKNGVGLVLDARREVEPSAIAVLSETPGFRAEIRAGNSRQGPFEPVSTSQTVESETSFDLSEAKARYFVVWITDLDGRARINEIRVS